MFEKWNVSLICSFGWQTLRIDIPVKWYRLFQDKPYVMIRDLEPGVDRSKLGNDLYEGFCVDLLREMAAIVGFEYKIVPVDDGLYGMLEDGKWNGIVRELIDRV